MRDTWTSHEDWVYRCNRCLATWHEEYDARHVADGHGGEAVVYEHDGQQCTSPWCDHVCPNCHSQNVKAFTAPWNEPKHAEAPHHPEDVALRYRLRRLGAY